MAKNVKEVKFNDNNVTVVVTVVTDDEGNKHFQAPEGYKMFPMDLDGITNPAMYGYDRDLIKSWKVGEKKRISYMVPVKEDMYNPIIAPDKAEDKRDERNRKCMVPGKNGNLIICREASCTKARLEGRCPYADGGCGVTHGEVSLDQMMTDSHFEPSIMDTTSDEAITNLDYEDFLDSLAQVQQKLADICRLKNEGYKIKEIAKFLKMKENTVGNDIRRIKALEIQYFKN